VKRVTIKDIAAKLNVDPATVSRALNNIGSISDATKEKVRETAKEMNYFPNSAARSLVMGKTNAIGVVVSVFFAPFTTGILRGIENAIVKTGYDIQLYTMNRFMSEGRPERGDDYLLKLLHERRFDALIQLTSSSSSVQVYEEYKKYDVPVVIIEDKSPYTYNVLFNNERAGFIAGEYLLKSGLKKPGIILSAPDAVTSMRERLRGFSNSLKNRGMELPENMKFQIFDDAEMTIDRIASEIIRTNPDGVFCASGDNKAVAVLKRLKRRGFDVSMLKMIGCDDNELADSFGLTTIRQPLPAMGEKALEMAAIAAQHGSYKPDTVIFEPELIIRETA